MAAAYKFYDRRGTRSYQNASNTLIAAATTSTDRKSVGNLDIDAMRNVSGLGRRTLMSLGRWLFSNVTEVRQTMIEQAEFASSSYLPDYRGTDSDFKSMAEEWMYQHDRICDVAGPPYTMRILRRNLIISVRRDGDCGLLLVKTPTGYPMIQMIPGHRIGSRRNESQVIGGIFDGAQINDGVIFNEFGRAIGYRVLRSDGFAYSDYDDIPASSMMLCFVPVYAGQLRGYSELGHSMFKWKDIAESDDFELIAQKVGAAIYLVEQNEDGAADTTKAAIQSAATYDASGHKTTDAVETISGAIRYFKAGTNSKIEAFRNARPTSEQQAFKASIVRSNLFGMGWSMDFSVDPTKIGGAPMRVVVERINRNITADQELILEPAMRRFDGYRLALAGRPVAQGGLGLFTLPPDWWQIEYQGPAQLTADAKYDSDVDIQERRSGRKTLSKSTAQRGESWLDIRNQIEIETDDKLARATRLSKKHDISLDLALSLLERTEAGGSTPLAQVPAKPEPGAPVGEKEDSEEGPKKDAEDE